MKERALGFDVGFIYCLFLQMVLKVTNSKMASFQFPKFL